MTTADMMRRIRDAFDRGRADVRRRVTVAEGVRPFAKNKDLKKAYMEGYAKAVFEIAQEAREETKKRNRYEFKGEIA